MSRLYITPREIDFFNDIAKEMTKDIVGQVIYYYPISFLKSNVHAVYEESLEKIIEEPIEINCLVQWEPPEVSTTKFGQDSILEIKVFVQSRDMIHKEIELKDGDFFSYGSELFEVTTIKTLRNIYGQIEYDDGIELIGRQVRRDNFAIKLPGPLKEKYSDSDAVKDTFYQQRGFAENQEGKTGDRRDLVDKGVISAPNIDKPAEISSKGTEGKKGNSFYGEGD